MTEELRGVVKAVIFKSKDESYCVFRIEEKGSGTSVTVTGNIVIPYVGENVVVRGGWLRHPRFGLQFRASILERMKPVAAESHSEKIVMSSYSNGMITRPRPSNTPNRSNPVESGTAAEACPNFPLGFT